MSARTFRRIPRLLPLLMVIASPAGCLFNGSDGTHATLDNVWPNADGSEWTYDLVQMRWESGALPLYPTVDAVPPVPSLDEVEDLLGEHPVGDPLPEIAAGWVLRFDGTITTESGATGQKLEQEIVPPPAPAPAPPGAGPHGTDPFLARLWAARPDLRARLAARGFDPGAADPRAAGVIEPLFLSGYAWEKSPYRIVAFGDLNRDPAWIYLEANLEPGHEFTIQLVPYLTDDVFLHARMLPRRNVATPAGTFAGVAECLYVVDYGVGKVTDASGILLGYRGTFSYGTVAYAPRFGPVQSFEQVLAYMGNPPFLGPDELRLDLAETNVGPRPRP